MVGKTKSKKQKERKKKVNREAKNMDVQNGLKEKNIDFYYGNW